MSVDDEVSVVEAGLARRADGADGRPAARQAM